MRCLYSYPAFLLRSIAWCLAFRLRSLSVHSVSRKHIENSLFFPLFVVPSARCVPSAFYGVAPCVPPAFPFGLQRFSYCTLPVHAHFSYHSNNIPYTGLALRKTHTPKAKANRPTGVTGYKSESERSRQSCQLDTKAKGQVSNFRDTSGILKPTCLGKNVLKRIVVYVKSIRRRREKNTP